MTDDIPELAEEFIVTITSVEGDAVAVTPSFVTVTITANDDQNGVVMFDPNIQSPLLINEDAADTNVRFPILRQGGLFGQVGRILVYCLL